MRYHLEVWILPHRNAILGRPLSDEERMLFYKNPTQRSSAQQLLHSNIKAHPPTTLLNESCEQSNARRTRRALGRHEYLQRTGLEHMLPRLTAVTAEAMPAMLAGEEYVELTVFPFRFAVSLAPAIDAAHMVTDPSPKGCTA